MKNPNGYGSVTKLSGNRRNPWIVREGKTGKQHPIGYAPTKEAGLIMLAQYNQTPWNIEQSKITLRELYDLWLEKRAPKLGKSNRSCMTCASKHIMSLSGMKYADIRSYHMQDCIDSCGKSYSTQRAIKNLFGHLDRFAMELDIISKQYSVLTHAAPVSESTREIFTDDEIALIWSNQSVPGMDTVLFLLYTGFRISEFYMIRTQDVDLESDIPTIKGGIKTEAGKNRIVPIHSKIIELVQLRYEQSQTGFLFENKGKQYNNRTYRRLWADLMNMLDMQHTPHECRHTLRSRLDSAGANKVCIDRIIGHKSTGTGERVYTHKTIEELKKNIELVTN